jgi:hypothetical protein
MKRIKAEYPNGNFIFFSRFTIDEYRIQIIQKIQNATRFNRKKLNVESVKNLNIYLWLVLDDVVDVDV